MAEQVDILVDFALDTVGTHGFFSAARNVNLAERKTFAKRTVEYVGALARETDLDQALENRRRLEGRWGSLLAEKGAPRGSAGREEGKGETGWGSLLAERAAAQIRYMEPPSGVRFEKVAL